MIDVSEIQLIPVRSNNGLTFFASFVLNQSFHVGNVAVFTRRNGDGFRLVYPTKRLKNGSELPIFYPINDEVGKQIEKAVSTLATQLLLDDAPEVSNE